MTRSNTATARREFLRTSLRLGAAACLAPVLTPCGQAADSTQAIPLGSRRELFVDNFLIERSQGVELKLHKPEAKEAAAGGHDKEAKDAKEPKDAKEAHSKKPGKGKRQTIALSKMVVNVAGSGGTRYLMSSATLVGSISNFKENIEENKDQLLDLAISTLSSKTISDLEKPGSRNQIRAELISLFNNALGSPLVQEIYFTEFAIQ